MNGAGETHRMMAAPAAPTSVAIKPSTTKIRGPVIDRSPEARHRGCRSDRVVRGRNERVAPPGQVDLVANSWAKAWIVRSAVIARAVKAPVDGPWTRRRTGWNSAAAMIVDGATASVSPCVRPPARPAGQPPQHEDRHDSARHDRPRRRTADEAIDIVQAVAQDRDADRDGRRTPTRERQ